MRSARRLFSGLVVAAMLATLAAGARAESPEMQAGAALFSTGARPGAPPPRAIATGSVALPASVLPCASCHGADGRGGSSEAGVRPPPITWSALSRATTTRPAYDEATLLRAVTQGTAAGGRALDHAMPRYALTLEDGAALVAFLRDIETRPVPGVGSGVVRLGLLLPAGPAGDVFAIAFRSALNAAAPRGVFGRRISLLLGAVTAEGGGAEAARQLMQRGEILALVSALPAELDAGAIGVARAAGVPVLSLRTAPKAAGAPLAFALLPGAAEEALALLRELPRPELALILTGAAPAERELAEVIAAAIGRGADSDPRILGPEELAEALPGASALVVLGGGAALPQEALAALRAAPGLPVLLPASAAATAAAPLAAALGRPVQLGLGVPPVGGAPQAPASARFVGSTAMRHGLPGRLGHATGEVVVEALRRAGRELTRERLSAALRSPEPYETGALPPLVPLRAGAAERAGRIWMLRVHRDGRLERLASTD
jgi:cytochrome c553